jgi:hypothetical protein
MKVMRMRPAPLVSLLLGLLLHTAVAASDTAAGTPAAAHYLIEKAHIPAGESACIPAFLYIPNTPLTQPPGLVVMVPALGQNALQQGLHSYAHAYAANGLAVLILSAPGSLATSSKDPKVRRFLLHCGKEQQQQQQQQQQYLDIPASLLGGKFRAAVSSYVQLLAQQGRVDAGRVAYWGAEWGAVVAVQAAAEQQQGAVQALILQVTRWAVCASAARTLVYAMYHAWCSGDAYDMSFLILGFALATCIEFIFASAPLHGVAGLVQLIACCCCCCCLT